MSRNLNQIPTQATSILATDKMYIARSPFGVTDDRYILGSDIIAQLDSPLTTKGDLFGFSTVDARLPVAVGDGKILQVSSGSALGLAYSTPTYPSASGTAAKILISDGTNNIYSTPTWPTAGGTAGSIVISDGTNKINSTSLWPNTVGTNLHILLSNGTSNIYSTPAYPNASVTAGKLIISDGTDYIASTSIWPNTVGTAGKLIRSDGTLNAYTTSTFADTYAANSILYAASANVVSGLGTIANAVMVTDGSAVPSFSTTLPAGLTIPGYQPSLTLPLSLANGGTGAALTANTGGIVYSGASAMAILAGTATAQQIVMSGATAAPSWSTATYLATMTANAIHFASATNVMNEIAPAASSVLISSAGSVPSMSQTLPTAVQDNITRLGTIVSGVWNGSIISLTYGGTNANLTASNGGIVWSNATQMQILGGTATARQMLQSGSTATPAWSTTTWPATTSANNLLYSSFNNTVAELASANGSVLTTSATGVPGFVAASTSGNILISDGTIWTSASSAGLGSPLTTKGDIYAYSTTNGRFPVATGDGKILQVSAAATFGLAYSTPTYPSASGSAGKILRADGTNNVYSTSTFADTYAAGTVLYATSSNTVAGLASKPMIQQVRSLTGSLQTGTTVMPSDNTIPQNTEGDEYYSLAITPSNSNNLLEIDVSININNSNTGAKNLTAALFQDSTANALAANIVTQSALTGGWNAIITFKWYMVAGTTSATTFKVRAGCDAAGTTAINAQPGTSTGGLGGVIISGIVIKEWTV